jgi:hypothetical protein
VDTSLWGPAGFATPSLIQPSDVDQFAGFVHAAGWSALYGVALKGSTPSAAAQEAAYARAQLGSSLTGFEIGNEPDNYKIAYGDFRAQWEAAATAIQAAGAGPLTGPATAGNYTGFTVPFASDEAGRINLLTQHYYRANGQLASSTLDLLLFPDPNLASILQAGVAAANANHEGFRLAEGNSFSRGGKSGISNSFGSALWGLDFLFANARYGSTGVNFHSGTSSYTPIADNGEARPLYYGMLLFTQAGTGTMVDTQASTNVNFTAYTIERSDGDTSVVLLNKDPATGVQANVDMGAAVGGANAIYLQAPSLTATSGVTLAGSDVSPSGQWSPGPSYVLASSGNTVSVLVPPASAALVHVNHVTSTARAIPGTIQAEDYDIGGENVAYFDTTPGNSGGAYRSDDVDIEATADLGGGFDVGWTAPGEWLNFSSNVASAGSYTLALRVAATTANNTMHVEVNGANVTGPITVPNTGGWQNWTTITTGAFSLSAGPQVVRVVFDSGGYNLNWMQFASASACAPTTCAANGANCGTLSDGCGGTLTCGTCAAPQTCGGGGTPNVCGGGGGTTCASAYLQGSCLTYSQGMQVSNGGHNWTCANANCANCAGYAACAPGGSGCPWGVVWADDGACN